MNFLIVNYTFYDNSDIERERKARNLTFIMDDALSFEHVSDLVCDCFLPFQILFR